MDWKPYKKSDISDYIKKPDKLVFGSQMFGGGSLKCLIDNAVSSMDINLVDES